MKFILAGTLLVMVVMFTACDPVHDITQESIAWANADVARSDASAQAALSQVAITESNNATTERLSQDRTERLQSLALAFDASLTKLIVASQLPLGWYWSAISCCGGVLILAILALLARAWLVGRY